MDDIRDPDLTPLDRELREIEFVERPSFAAELRARLRDARVPRFGRRRSLIAAAVAALALAMLPLTDFTSAERAGSDAQPVLVNQRGGSPGALYFAVNADGRVLELDSNASDRERPGAQLVSDGRQPAFVCMFAESGSRCGSPEILHYESGAPLGPFVYRDICCGQVAGSTGSRDGVLTISGLRESIIFIFLYEDVNADGRMSAGDRLRLRAHPSAPPIDEFPLPLFASGQHGFTGPQNGLGELPDHGMSVFAY